MYVLFIERPEAFKLIYILFLNSPNQHDMIE